VSKTSGYQPEKLFISVYYDLFLRRPTFLPEEHPLEVMKSFEEKGVATLGRSIRTTMMDIVSGGLRPEELQRLDLALAKSGAPSLAQMRRRYLRKYATILQRGVLKNDEEFYLLKSMLDDPDLPGDDRAKILPLINAYEGI
jgi:hypothetical protein